MNANNNDSHQRPPAAPEDTAPEAELNEEERQFKAEGLAMAEAIVKGLNEAVLKNYPTS